MKENAEEGVRSSAAEVRTGYIRGNTFEAKEVRYEVVDGKAIFEGDIVLGTAEEVERFSETVRKRTTAASGAPPAAVEGVVISGDQFRWPNAIVPYEIDGALPNQNRVTDAIAHWERNTVVRFVLRTAANQASWPDYVHFEDDGGGTCESAVGRKRGRQNINLGPGCDAGRAIHEIGHAVGLWHEQSREDRDTFVRIESTHIQVGKEHNFDQHISDGDDIGAYDYGSIMHYPRDAFSKDGKDTITTLKPVPAGVTVGQRTALSAGDIAAVRAIYPTALWASMGGSWPGDPGVGRNADGRIELFLRGTDANMYHAWQTAPSNGWSDGWAPMGGSWHRDPVVANNSDGRMELFVVGDDTQLYHAWQTAPSNGWSQGWESMGGSWPGAPVVGRNADGRLEAFLRGNDAQLYHAWQTAPNNGWSGWESMGGSWHRDPVVVSNADGRMEVFLVGDDTQLYHAWQTAPNNGWSQGWESRGGSWPGNLGAGRNADGRLEVFLRGNDAQLYHAWQTAPNNGWSDGWESLGGSWHHEPLVTRNADGRLELFVVGDDTRLYQIWQTAPNNGWSGWARTGAWWTSWHAMPAGTNNADGRLEIFLRGNDTQLYHAWQTAPNNGWALI